MQNLAAGLSAGVQKFAKKKEKKKADQSATDLLVRFGGANPKLADGLGLEYLDENGQFSEEVLRKSSKSFVDTTGHKEVSNTILTTLGLGVQSEKSAAAMGSQQRDDKYDTAGFQKIVQTVNSLPDIYKLDNKNGNQIILKSTGQPLTGDMPEADPFLNQRGSGFFGLYNMEAPTPALSVGGGATPTGEVLEQDGVQYSKYSDGTYRPNN